MLLFGDGANAREVRLPPSIPHISPPPPGKGHSLLFQGVSPMKATILEQNNCVAMETPPSLPLSGVFSFLAILSQPVYSPQEQLGFSRTRNRNTNVVRSRDL